MPAIAILLCYAAMMCLAIAVNLLPVFLTTLSTDMGSLSSEQLGRIGAVTFAGLVAAIVVTGPIVDRLPRRGPKSFAIMGNVLIACGLLLLALASSYGVVLLAVFVMGFGAGVLDMVLSPIVAAMQPKHRTMAMNLLHSFYCTGAVLTILAGALALRYGIGWRHCALCLIPMPLVVGLGFLFLTIPPLVAEGADRTSIGHLAGEPYFLLACVVIFLGGATELAMAYWLPTYAERDLGSTKFTAGIAFLGFSLAMAVGRIAIGMLGHRVSGITLMLYCSSGSVVLFLVASFGQPSTLALAGCIAAGLTGSALWPSTVAIAADRYPNGGATMFGILSALGNLGGIFMPWMAGLIADASTLHLGLATSALCPLLMIPALLYMRRHRVPASELIPL